MASVIQFIRDWRWRRWRRALFSDQRSWQEFQRLSKGLAPGEAVPLAIRELRGYPVWCRPDKPDANGLFNVFGAKFHLPPLEPRTNGVILDLGANLGYTALHFAAKYPTCRIVAVEMDQDNFARAKHNLGNAFPQCSLVNAAVWIEDGSITYDGTDPEALSIEQVRGARGEGVETTSRQRSAPAKTIDTILAEQGLSSSDIDYVKMDIEGAEHRVLEERTGWLDRVRLIKVEYHKPATSESVIEILTNKGFRAWRDPHHWACVAAVRD